MKTDEERYGDTRAAIAARDLDLTIKHISELPGHLKRAALESLRHAWPDDVAALVEDVVESGWMRVAEKIEWRVSAGRVVDAKTALAREEWSASYRSIRIDHGDPLEVESSKEERRMVLVEAVACLGMLRVWAFHREGRSGGIEDRIMAREEERLLSFWTYPDRVREEPMFVELVPEARDFESFSYYLHLAAQVDWGAGCFFDDALRWLQAGTGISEDELANLTGIHLIRHRVQSYLTPRGREREKVRLGVRQRYVLEEMYLLEDVRSVQRMSSMSKSEVTRILDSLIKHGLIEKDMGDYRITEKGERAAKAIIREKRS